MHIYCPGFQLMIDWSSASLEMIYPLQLEGLILFSLGLMRSNLVTDVPMFNLIQHEHN